MKQLILFLVIITGIIGCQNKQEPIPGDTPKEPAQEQIDFSKLTEAEKQELGNKMMESIVAGEQHKELQKFVGTWNFKTHTKSSNSGDTVFSGSGTTINRLILDGKFLVSESEKKDDHLIAVGLMVIGYDRTIDRYTTTMYSDGGTNYITSQGAVDPGAKEKNIRTSGTYYNPILKNNDAYDIILEPVSENRYRVVIDFKDPATRSTQSSMIIDYEKVSNPVR